jgi:thiol-disulfide isomerase/thioredoxin
MGVVMVLTALAILVEADLRFQTAIADDLPAVLVNPTGALERSHAVEGQLADLRGEARFTPASSGLPELGEAPEFEGVTRWLNSPPLTLRGLRGKVVLIDFWTYTCINCIRTLPYLRAWDERYRADGLRIVGVHSPEFAFEKDAGNVARAIRANGLRYPVVQDNDLATWDAWGNQYWPAKYLIDAQGQVRDTHFGEGEYDKTEDAIRALLDESGERAQAKDVVRPGRVATPETYVGSDRADGFAQRPRDGTHGYRAPAADALALNEFALGGVWRVDGESATAGVGATLSARFLAKAVYLVLSPPPDGPGRVLVSIDGGPPRTIVVRTQRLYTLARFTRSGEHVLTLRPQPGVAGYAFTFG